MDEYGDVIDRERLKIERGLFWGNINEDGTLDADYLDEVRP